MNIFEFFDNVRERLPEDVVLVFNHSVSVAFAIVAFAQVAELAKLYVHEVTLVQTIEFADHVVLVVFVLGLGIEFIGTLILRIKRTFFGSWVLLA